jgi:hypothetical protein
VYEIGDLEKIAREVENLSHVIRAVVGYLGSDDASWRASRLPQLCSEPRLEAELARLRQRRKDEV